MLFRLSVTISVMNGAQALLCFLLLACSGAGDHSAAETTAPPAATVGVPADAKAPPGVRILQDTILREPLEGRHVYIAQEPITGGTTIPTWGRTVTVPAKFARAWFIFV